MRHPDEREVIGIIGGTGPQGRGLGVRWALAGHPVHLGSRSAQRAADAAEDVRRRAGRPVEVTPGTNEEVARAADVVVVSLPYEAQQPALPELRDAIGDKVVVNVVNPMAFDEVGPHAVPVEAGSAGEECQQLLPDARVVSGFHNVSSRRLLHADEPVVTHVLLCGDDQAACHLVAQLAGEIAGMWAVYCGPLRNSSYLENITPLLLWINRHYRVQSGLVIDALERDQDTVDLHTAEGGAGAA